MTDDRGDSPAAGARNPQATRDAPRRRCRRRRGTRSGRRSRSCTRSRARRQPGSWSSHDDVLEQVAEAGLDGPLVVARPPRGSRPPTPRCRTRPFDSARTSRAPSPYAGAGRVELFERASRRVEPGQLVLARPDVAGAPLAFAAGAGELGLARRAREARERLDASRARGARLRASLALRLGGPLGFDAQVVVLRPRAGSDRSATRSRAAAALLDRVAQRRRGVHRGEHLAARRLDVRLEPFDLRVRGVVRGLCRQRAPRPRSRARLRARSTASRAAVELQPRRLAPRLERRRARRRSRSRGPSSALRPAAARSAICCCSRPISSSRACAASRAAVARTVGLRQLDAKPFEVASTLGEPCGRRRFTLRGRRSASVARGRFDGLRAARGTARANCTFSQRRSSSRSRLYRRALAAWRFSVAALFLDLEDDVVDARQVLLRRLELQLRRAAPALVLGDAGRLFDQLPPIGRDACSGSDRSSPAR